MTKDHVFWPRQLWQNCKGELCESAEVSLGETAKGDVQKCQSKSALRRNRVALLYECDKRVLSSRCLLAFFATAVRP